VVSTHNDTLALGPTHHIKLDVETTSRGAEERGAAEQALRGRRGARGQGAHELVAVSAPLKAAQARCRARWWRVTLTPLLKLRPPRQASLSQQTREDEDPDIKGSKDVVLNL